MQGDIGTANKLTNIAYSLETDHHPFVGYEKDSLLSYYRFSLAYNKKEPAYGVFSVWGISGVGKSFLVEHLYYDIMTRCGAEDFKYGWLDVSRPFDLMDLSWSLLSDLDPTYVPQRPHVNNERPDSEVP